MRNDLPVTGLVFLGATFFGLEKIFFAEIAFRKKENSETMGKTSLFYTIRYGAIRFGTMRFLFNFAFFCSIVKFYPLSHQQTWTQCCDEIFS